jgi:iron(III) transport system substrate-binding protein
LDRLFRAARLMIRNKAAKTKSDGILSYVDPNAKGKAVIANPLFGTTTAYVAALFTIWGDDKAKQFLNDLKANQVKVSTGNGESAILSPPRIRFCLVDSDDAVSRVRQGKPIEIIYPDQGPGQVGALVLPMPLF